MNEDKDKKTPEDGEERTVFMPSLPAGEPKGADIPPDSPFYIPPDAPVPEPEKSSEAEAPSPAEHAPSGEPEAPEPAPAVDSEETVASEEPAGDATSPPAADEPAAEPPATDAASEPAPPEPPAAEAASEPAPGEPAVPSASPEEARTVVAPAGEIPAETTSRSTTATSGPIEAREGARPIKIGDVLNHIFEVKRFIGRGGMGEVFEGVNVNTDERVAIKVMLPAMAADEKVVAMFRKEARTLTKLQHEALVQYRVLAQEPQLGVLYIVTEFIEGVELCDMLGKVEYKPEELAGLLRRLASGLAAAHRLGAIHRDMSPDNVLLEGGDIHKATIIDFGIAKDLDSSSATIVGDGFAGKLNYVAPEQLGDYGRDVGPWTDVYSLALVILAVAQGKNVNMSGSLVDAIDKRRKGPDLSAVPSNIKGLLEDMLRPDPKERIRSMEEVLARLGGGGSAPPPPPPPPVDAAPVAARSSGGPNKGLLIGGAALVAALAIGGGAWYFMQDDGIEIVDGNEVGPADDAPPGDPEAVARSAINSALPSVTCTWLDIGSVQSGDGSLRVAMKGVAGDGRAAQQELMRALSGAGLQNVTVGFGDVAPITPAGCAALDTYRQVRASSDYRLSIPQTRYPMGSPANLEFDLSDVSRDFALLGIEPSGAITMLIPNRAAFETEVRRSVDGRPIADLGNGRYRLSINVTHQGWSGFILVSGQGPFDRDLVAPPFGSRGPSWQQEFLSAASRGNWRVEMAWFESVSPESSAPATGLNPGRAPD